MKAYILTQISSYTKMITISQKMMLTKRKKKNFTLKEFLKTFLDIESTKHKMLEADPNFREEYDSLGIEKMLTPFY